MNKYTSNFGVINKDAIQLVYKLKLMPEEKNKVALLFREIQKGDKDSFNELFDLYYSKLLAFARQYTGQQESAEEITSELFVRLWLKREGLLKILNPEAYLFISIKNACLNLIRYNKKRAQLINGEPTDYPIEQVESASSSLLEDKELIRMLDTAIAALPERRRLIFRLVKEQGLKNSAVAEILGISIRTVENQLYKAIKTLANALYGYLGYHPQNKASEIILSIALLLFFAMR